MKKTALLIVAGVVLLAALPALAAMHYFQGFETDITGWEGITRVASGTDGVASGAGEWHAEVAKDAYAFTRFGGYEPAFPAGGYTTSIDIYLDVNGEYANDTRMDWTSAIGTPTLDHRRDFIFHVGFYNDSDSTGTGNRFVVSASNNAPGWPKNPGRDHVTITQSGWYTFEHRFYKKTGGVLAVDLRVTNLTGDEVFTWTLSDPSDIVGDTVGGHRYGWFATQGFPFLAIDNVNLLSVNMAGSVAACKSGGWQQFTRENGSLFQNQGDCIQYVNTGK